MKVLHEYETLIPGILIKRYKRFLADVQLDDGPMVTAYTPNSGTMKTCSDPGSPVMLAYEPHRGRKTAYTLEMVRSDDIWVGVNTILANSLGARIIDLGLTGLNVLEGFKVAGKEVPLEDSRLDLIAGDGTGSCYIEIKNVTYKVGDTAMFPDAVTARGKKHLETLTKWVRSGGLSCNLYIVQRSDCGNFSTADHIDPEYARAFERAVEAGVLIVPCLLDVRPEAVFFSRTLPVLKSWE